jgi:glycosyltransferase involved in cell wall biosynthesis
MTRPVAFVVQRCGLEVNGGAECLCRTVAEKLSATRPTEVLTTCARDYMTWENHYRPGEERLGDLRIRRFPVARPRDVASFDRLSETLRPRVKTAPVAEQEQWMREQGPWSPDLFEYLQRRRADYDAFVFVTYLYATTYFGLPLVSDKALLVPLAHDEWPIYFGMWDRLFERPRGFVFSSAEEAAFVRRRFPAARLEGPVVGTGVEPPASVDPARFRKKYGIEGPFILYAGRVDVAKGVDQLLRDFQAYRREISDQSTHLVLLGRTMMEIPSHPAVQAVGFVSEEDKWDALAACEALVMPSSFESLSIALLEAWSVGKPVLVNARSEVMVGQCRRSHGGLWYGDTGEFCVALECLLQDGRVRRALGAQGREFVSANYRWARIVEAYGEEISRIASR